MLASGQVSEQRVAEPGKSAVAAPPRRGRSCALGVLVGVCALGWLGFNLPAENRFADESAYISQAYYADLWLRADRNNEAWLAFPALDLVPVPKYLIGLALRTGGYPRPLPEAARRWYFNTSFVCGTPEMLEAARWPSVIVGALGCVAVYALGLMAADRRVGVVSALLLMANPLYRLLARRAMADMPAEAFLLVTLALGLCTWKRTLARGWSAGASVATLGIGICGGVAVASKLNGVLGLWIVGAWALLGLALPGFALRRKLAFCAATTLAMALAFGTFVALNPYLTAHPAGALPESLRLTAALGFWGRCRALVEHRLELSAGQQQLFPHNALVTLRERAKVVAVQGFGRFGPFGPAHSDSTKRYDPDQDWGALIWLPWVAIGFVWSLARGRAPLRPQPPQPPATWAIALEWLVALAVVTLYLPMAWDRYQLSIQSGSCLLGGAAAVWLFDFARDGLRAARDPRPGS